MEEPALILQNISRTFLLDQYRADTIKGRIFGSFIKRNAKVLKAVDSVNLTLMKGETLGLIGRNGSGKSTLLKIMSSTLLPDKGGVVKRFGTYMLMNLSVGISHELTARENIYVAGSTFGLRIKEISAIFDNIIEFAELEDFVDSKVKYYSSGMIQRLCFSIAVNAGADIMFLDEVFAVGDAPFKQKAIQVLEQNWIEGRTVVIASHGLAIIRNYCDRVLYLKNGKVAFLGDPETAIKIYLEDNNVVENELTTTEEES